MAFPVYRMQSFHNSPLPAGLFFVLRCNGYKLNITVRRSRQSGVARATCPD